MKPSKNYDPSSYAPDHVKEIRSQIKFSIGINVKIVRKKHDETLKTLAHALNITDATLCKYENGLIEFPSSLLLLIADRYNVPISVLYDEECFKEISLEKALFKNMISRTMSQLDDFLLDYTYYTNILLGYFQKFLSTDNPNSFDLYFALCNFLEELDIILKNDQNIVQQRIEDVSVKLLENLSRIRINDYNSRLSVFLNELLPNISDEWHFEWLEFEKRYFKQSENN